MKLKVGVTVRFQNSYFSGGAPQTAIALANALALSGHDVTLLYPKDAGERDWFIDVRDYAEKCPPRQAYSPDSTRGFDVIVEVVWYLPAEERPAAAKHSVLLVHKPPIFHDMESSVYAWNPVMRDFRNLSAIWTYDLYSKQDVQYLAFLSGVAVYQIPYIWNPDALDAFVAESGVPAWSEGAAASERALPPNVPPALSWSARIVESNFTNTSHCLIPLNVVSELRLRGIPVRFGVHNAETTAAHEFFQSNIVKNLALPDWKESMHARVRLPDFCREKTCLIAHQRWRPLKSFLLDALYLGIPMIHNCATLKSMGAPYIYELNQIQQAVEAWQTMQADYTARRAFFDPKAAEIRKAALRSRFSPGAVAPALAAVLQKPMARVQAIAPIVSSGGSANGGDVLRVAFCNMWEGFVPSHNFFVYLLAWVGSHIGVKVVVDEAAPNLVVFGPMSGGAEARYPGVPKVYYTGENAPPSTHPDVFLNLGFQHRKDPGYIRLPLWVLEVNWFGGDVDKMANPKPVSVAAATAVPDVSGTRKFCAFVASNPNNANRNVAFQILNNWRRVDSAGRLMCNMAGGPLPAGAGGGGGELVKVEFYKQYKFVLAYENSSAPGYTTEKLFHAKVAGAVPIYWGDPFVDRDFDPRGFLNANQVSTPESLIQLVKAMDEDSAAWKAAAAVPAISAEKRAWCEQTMADVAARVFKTVMQRDVSTGSLNWSRAEGFAATYSAHSAVAPAPIHTPAAALSTAPPSPVAAPLAVAAPTPAPNGRRIFVTAANSKYMEAALNAVASMRTHHGATERIVYVWPDVSEQTRDFLRKQGATDVREFPVADFSQTPWSDFWDPQHFAWKLWLIVDALGRCKEQGTALLYGDAGALWVHNGEALWRQIDTEGILLFDDASQTNARWCHPTFCHIIGASDAELRAHQLWAGVLGVKQGASYVQSVFEKALALARNHREAIVGEKWSKYSDNCMGHRHDQSILSVLSQRAGAPRIPMNDYYTDISMQHAVLNKKVLYVHRGAYRDRVAFAAGIDDAYVVNLERRGDRMKKFQEELGDVAKNVYRWNAVDGRALTLTPQLIALFRDNDFRWKKSVMGCALSHLGIWERLARDEKAKTYLVLEDDVRFVPDWMAKWQAAVPNMPSDADVVYLGGVLPPNKPGLPHCTEAVNAWFGRVAPNTMFQGGVGTPRRYFHFCTYAYVLTKSGAQKLLGLVQQRGIFTSADHMIVNHGDGLLNIYFTTPLLATCFQEDDPIYQKADFNNFQRIDNFDSDLWNNTDCFQESEVRAVLESAKATAAAAAPAQAPPEAVWNAFLRAVAERDLRTIRSHIDAVFKIWSSHEAFLKHGERFRIFERMLIVKNPVLMEERSYIKEKIHATFSGMSLRAWDAALAVLEDVPVPVSAPPAPAPAPVQHLFTIHPFSEEGFLERDWLEYIFGKRIVLQQLETVGQLVDSDAYVLYQKTDAVPIASVVQTIANLLAGAGKSMRILHLSDEFASDDITVYGSAGVKSVLRNYTRPDLTQYGEKVCVLPLGPAKGRMATATTPNEPFTARPYVWSFIGSMDRPGRAAALDSLKAIEPNCLKSKAAWDTPYVAQTEEYVDVLHKSKFVPCMRGSCALESFRLYEALEHGAIPFFVASEAQNGDEYAAVLGKHPILGFNTWAEAAATLPQLLANPAVLESHRQALQAWWTAKKASVKARVAAI